MKTKSEMQDLEWAIPKIKKLFIKNPNRSVSATLRHLRKHPRFSRFGDDLILHTIIRTIAELGIFPSRNKIWYAMNQTEEHKEMTVKEKKELLDHSMNYITVQKKNGKKCP